MSIHEIAPLIQGALATGVLVLVLLKGGLSRPATRWFALFIIGQMLWGLVVFGYRASDDLTWALRWERFAPLAVSLTASSFYYFSRNVIRGTSLRWVNILAVAHVFISVASIPTPFLVEKVEVASYGNNAVFTLAIIPWMLPVYLMMGVSLANLYRGFKSASTYTERNRLLLLLMAASMSVLGGLLDVAPVLGLDVPPATSWTNSIFFILAGIAILRYNLLDIQVAFQHRLSYVLRSSVNVLLLALATLFFNLVNLPVWSIVVLDIAVLVLAEPFWRRVDTLLRARLEKDLRGEMGALLTMGSKPGANMAQIGDVIVQVVHKVIDPERSALLLLQDGEARPLVSRGLHDVSLQPLPADHPLVGWLKSQPVPAFRKDLIVEPQFQSISPENMELMEALGATVYVPLMSREALEGVLAVGPKTGQSVYTWQEIEFLSALGQQGALLLESIRLSEAERAQRERMEHLQELQRHMIQARDEERRALAAEIHDEPIQMLAGTLVRLNLIRDSLLTRPELSKQQLEHSVSNIMRAEKSLRRIMSGVFPSALQDLGIHAALEALCQDLGKNGMARTPVHLTLSIKGIPSGWNPPLNVGLVIYRFIQEGLRNLLSHSGATEAWVNVEYRPDSATIEVIDNGKGVDLGRVVTRRQEGHVGLLGLEERLGSVGGTMVLSNRAEGGARLWAQFPHQSPSPDGEATWMFEYSFVPLPVAEAAVETPVKASVRSLR